MLFYTPLRLHTARHGEWQAAVYSVSAAFQVISANLGPLSRRHQDLLELHPNLTRALASARHDARVVLLVSCYSIVHVMEHSFGHVLNDLATHLSGPYFSCLCYAGRQIWRITKCCPKSSCSMVSLDVASSVIFRRDGDTA